MSAMATGEAKEKLGDFQTRDGKYLSLALEALSLRVATKCPCTSSIKMKPQGPCLLHFDELMSRYHISGIQESA